jgi:hypothetical protein
MGGEILGQFEDRSPTCLQLDFFTGRFQSDIQDRSGNLSPEGIEHN